MEKAFLIGADEKLSDILFWWLHLKQKFTPQIPVQIVDFGLSPYTLTRLESQGLIIISLDKMVDKGHVWFNKPQAMLASKAEITLWMDIDTEIMADISDVFDLAEDDKLGLCKDQYYHSVNRPQHNSGVVLYKKIPTLLKNWAEAINTSGQRGDQEVLLELLNTNPSLKDSVYDLPDKYNYVRLMYRYNASAIDDLRVVHWTGPTGKNIIRSDKKMGRMNIEVDPKIHSVQCTKDLGHDFRGDENQYRPEKEEHGSKAQEDRITEILKHQRPRLNIGGKQKR